MKPEPLTKEKLSKFDKYALTEDVLSALKGLKEEIEENRKEAADYTVEARKLKLSEYQIWNSEACELAFRSMKYIIDKWFPILLSSDQKVEDLQDTDKVGGREQTDTYVWNKSFRYLMVNTALLRYMDTKGTDKDLAIFHSDIEEAFSLSQPSIESCVPHCERKKAGNRVGGAGELSDKEVSVISLFPDVKHAPRKRKRRGAKK